MTSTDFGRRKAPSPAATGRPLDPADLFVILSFVGVAMLYEHWVWTQMLGKPMAPPAWILDRGNAWSTDPAAIRRGWAPYWLVLGLAGLLGGGLGWMAAGKGRPLKYLPTLWRGLTTYVAVWVAAFIPLNLSGVLFGEPTINPLKVAAGLLNGVVGGVGSAVIELGFGGLFLVLPLVALWTWLTWLIAKGLGPRGDG